MLGKGEQKELRHPGIYRFSAGNREVLKTHVQKNTLFVKGKKLGFSDLIVWDARGRLKYQLYVVSKKVAMENAHILAKIQTLGLSKTVQHTIGTKKLSLSGMITNRSQYDQIKKIYQSHKNSINLEIQISDALARELLTQVIVGFQKIGLPTPNCELARDRLYFDCTIYGKKTSKKTLQKIEKDFFLNVHNATSLLEKKNLKLTLILLEISEQSGRQFSLGLNQINSVLKNLVSDTTVFPTRIIQVAETQFNMKTLAIPSVLTRLNQKNSIQIGEEVSFQTNLATQSANQNSSRSNQNLLNSGALAVSAIDWKETGFKLNFTLNQQNHRLAINYDLSLGRQQGNNIGRTREKSSLFLRELGQIQQVFNIGIHVDEKGSQGVPILSSIPVLGHLFKSHRTSTRYKKILGFIRLDLPGQEYDRI